MKSGAYSIVIITIVTISLLFSAVVHAQESSPSSNTSSPVSACMQTCGDPAGESYSSCLNTCLGISSSPEAADTIEDTVTPTTVMPAESNSPKVSSRFSACRSQCQSKGFTMPVCFVGCFVKGPSTTISTFPVLPKKTSWFEQLKQKIFFWQKPAILSGKACGIGANDGDCKRCEDKTNYYDEITDAWYCGEKPASSSVTGVQPFLPTITIPPLPLPTLAVPTVAVPTLSAPSIFISPEASSSGQ